MAAITGLPTVIPVRPMGPSVSDNSAGESPASAFRSKPAQKFPPAPVSTATAIESALSNFSNAALSTDAVSESTAFLTSGRVMVTVITPPSAVTWTFDSELCAVRLLRVHVRIAVIGRRRVGLFDRARTDPANQVQERARFVIG